MTMSTAAKILNACRTHSTDPEDRLFDLRLTPRPRQGSMQRHDGPLKEEDMPDLPVHDTEGACSLAEQDAAARNAEFVDVVERGLRHRERPSDCTVRLVFDNWDALDQNIRELARRESQCCGFFSFDIEVTGDDIVLQVNAPPENVAYLHKLYEATDPQRIAGRSGSR